MADDPHRWMLDSSGPTPTSPTAPAPCEALELQLEETQAALQQLVAGLPACEEMVTQLCSSILSAAASPLVQRGDAGPEVREVATQVLGVEPARFGVEAEGEPCADVDSASALRSQLAELREALSVSERDADEAWRAAHEADQRLHDAVGPQQAMVSRLQAALASHADGLDVREVAVRGAEARLRQHVSQWRELMEMGTASSPAAAEGKKVALAAAAQLGQEQSARRVWQQRAEAAEADLEGLRLRADAAADQRSLESLHERFGGASGLVEMGMATPTRKPVATARALFTDPPVGVVRASGPLVAEDSHRSPTRAAPAVSPLDSGGSRGWARPAQGRSTAGRSSLLCQPAVRLLLSEVEALQAELTHLQHPARTHDVIDAAWAEREGAQRRRQAEREVWLVREAARTADLEAELLTTQEDLIHLHRVLAPLLHHAIADGTQVLPSEMQERVAVDTYRQLSDEQLWLALHGCGARVPRGADRRQLCVLCLESGIDATRLVPAAWARAPADCDEHGGAAGGDFAAAARVSLSLGGGESGEGFLREAAWMASPDVGALREAGWGRGMRKSGTEAAGHAASAPPMSPVTVMLDPPSPRRPLHVRTTSEEVDWDSEEGRQLAGQMFACAREERGHDATVALQNDRLMHDAWFREVRWAAAREMLVGLACAMRDRTFLASVFYAWATYRWKRAALLASDGPRLPYGVRRAIVADDRPQLLILTSLEHHRIRLTQLLHEAHAENRWLRQSFSGTAAHKQLLLAWIGDSRLLQRCWLAWGAHITRSRMAREQRGQVHQLAFALRVASLSQAPDMAFGDGLCGRPHPPRDEAFALFAGYVTRRAWTAWRAAVTLARIEAQYQQRVEATLTAERERLQRLADVAHPLDSQHAAPVRTNGGDPAEGFSLRRLFSSSAGSSEDGQSGSSAPGTSSTTSEWWQPADSGAPAILRPATSAEATRLQLARHRDMRALSVALFGWRIVKTSTKLRQMQVRSGVGHERGRTQRLACSGCPRPCIPEPARAHTWTKRP